MSHCDIKYYPQRLYCGVNGRVIHRSIHIYTHTVHRDTLLDYSPNFVIHVIFYFISGINIFYLRFSRLREHIGSVLCCVFCWLIICGFCFTFILEFYDFDIELCWQTREKITFETIYWVQFSKLTFLNVFFVGSRLERVIYEIELMGIFYSFELFVIYTFFVHKISSL